MGKWGHPHWSVSALVSRNMHVISHFSFRPRWLSEIRTFIYAVRTRTLFFPCRFYRKVADFFSVESPKLVSALFLGNYTLEVKETSWHPSLPKRRFAYLQKVRIGPLSNICFRSVSPGLSIWTVDREPWFLYDFWLHFKGLVFSFFVW